MRLSAHTLNTLLGPIGDSNSPSKQISSADRVASAAPEVQLGFIEQMWSEVGGAFIVLFWIFIFLF